MASNTLPDTDGHQPGPSETCSVTHTPSHRKPLRPLNRNRGKDQLPLPLTQLEANIKVDVKIVCVEVGKVIRIINNGEDVSAVKY